MTYISSIGSTHEGREMPAVLLTASTNPNRKKVYMQCQIHAREFSVPQWRSSCILLLAFPRAPSLPVFHCGKGNFFCM